MKKRITTIFIALLAIMGFQGKAQEVKKSVDVTFENGQMVEGVDIKQGFGSVTFEVTENPVGFEGWDGADAPADPLNESEMCMFVERPSNSAVWDGPLVRLKGVNGEDGVLISAQDPSTHFLHIQALLPEGTVAGKGTFVINAYVHTIDGDKMDPRLIHDSSTPGSNVPWPSDYQAMTWHEFDFDLRPFLGNTIRKVQIQAERGGSYTWYIDNVSIDNRRKGFKSYDFGENIEITEETDQMLVFYQGTKCCLTAQDQPAKGFAQTTFQEYDPENSYQVWNVMVDPDKKQSDGSPLYTIEYDYSYLYNDGTLRATSDSDNMRWFATKYSNRPKYKDPLLINAGTWKYLRPRFIVDGVETEATADTTGWVFIKATEVEQYLATITAEVEKQPDNGDYVIFYAGTNYCMTDQRIMTWYKGNNNTDSMYIPQARYPLTLEEYDPENTSIGQVWQIRYFSDLVDNEITRTFFDQAQKVNNLPRVNTHRFGWWENSDSTTRAVGARLILTRPFDLVWKDSNKVEHTIEGYQNLFGDNATMINWDNSNVWFVKQIPMNKDGKCAMYRPNNGLQGTALQARYAGGALYAASASNRDAAEMKQYVWSFIQADDPVLTSKESAKSLINKDTVFGYPVAIPAGNYRIVYRGTNQVLAMNAAETTLDKKLLTKTFDKEDPEQIWTIAPVTNPKQGWEDYSDQFYMNIGDYRIINNAAQDKDVSLYTPEAAAALGAKEEESYFRALLMENPSVYGIEKSYILYANEKLKKFLRIANPINGSLVRQYNSTGTITVDGRVWPECNIVLQSVDADLPTITREFPEQLPLLEEGFYYIQYSYANDANDLSKTYVLAPPTPSVEGAFTVLEEYDESNLGQQWYVAYIDTANLRKVQAGDPEAVIDNRYFLFASAEIRDTVAKGAGSKELLSLPSGAVFNVNDWNKIVKERNKDWHSYRFYSKAGKVCLKESHARWLVDHVSAGEGVYKIVDKAHSDLSLTNNGVDDSGWDSHRIFVFNLVKAGEAFKPVSELAPWHPDYNTDSFVLGDVNGDGKINVSDVVTTVNDIVGALSGEYNEKAADMNSDGKVNISDVVAIVNVILGSEDIAKSPALPTGALSIEGGEVILSSNANIGGFDFAYEGELTAIEEALKDFEIIRYTKDGSKRMIAYTMKRGVLKAGETLLFKTAGAVAISDIIFVAEDAAVLTMDEDIVTSNDFIMTTDTQITVADGILSATGATSIEIYSMTGALLKQSATASVSVSDLASGTYFAKVFTANGDVTEKVIIP